MRPRATPHAARDVSLTDQAYDAIKEKIICLDLPPGSLFTESQLAAELGFSKTPIREALGRLRREGLAEVSARSGYRAAAVTLKEARDLFDVRLLLETEAVDQAARHFDGSDHLAELEELCRRAYDPNDRTTVRAFMRANNQFHAAIARLSNNNYLADMLALVLDKMDRLFLLGLSLTPRSPEIAHEHESLLEAIKAGDPARARRIAADQIQASQKMVFDALLSSSSLVTTNLAPVRREKAEAPSV